MYLIDTSVLIDYLRGEQTKPAEKFQTLIDQGISFGINEIIYMEVLQGARDYKEFKILKDYLSSQKFYNLRSEITFYEDAASIYIDCCRKGLIISSSINCLIAQNALDHDLILMHNDRDYVSISKVRPLKFVN